VIDHVAGVSPHLVEQAGAEGVEPVEADQIEPRHLGDAAPVTRVAAFVEQRQVDPAEVEAIAGPVDDAGDPGVP
jgi:hypothetical protein